MNKQIKKNKKGFTLVEMIVVIAIIGVLAAMMIPSLLGYINKAHASNNRATAATISRAIATAIAEDESLKDFTNATKLALLQTEVGKVLESAKGAVDVELNGTIVEVKYTKGSSALTLNSVAVTPAQSTETEGYYPEP